MASQLEQSGHLQIRSGQRRYQPAAADNVVAVALSLVDQRMQRGGSFSNPVDSRRFFQDKLNGLEREVFAAAFLDTRHRLIEYVEVFQASSIVEGAPVRDDQKFAPVQRRSRHLGAKNHPAETVEPQRRTGR